MITRILVPTDGSPVALEAASYAADVARRFGAPVTVIHVVEEVALPVSPGVLATGAEGQAEGQIEQALVEAGQEILKATAEPFTRAGVAVQKELQHGSAAQVIAEVAARGRYDLIVIGSHGKGAAARLFLGSVSEAVARCAPCPVLIVRKGMVKAAERFVCQARSRPLGVWRGLRSSSMPAPGRDAASQPGDGHGGCCEPGIE